MDAHTPLKKACESCLFWDGKPTSYLGLCCHPRNYPSRVSFDHACPLYIRQEPLISLDAMTEEAPLPSTQ
ncbi:MAG TPA: hypothetical protein VFZ66_30235 [Herpetosiphonaceae bacterium]